MKHIATVALMLNLGVASLYAQQRPIKMTFSGSMVPTAINLGPNTITDEELLAGKGRARSPRIEQSAERYPPRVCVNGTSIVSRGSYCPT